MPGCYLVVHRVSYGYVKLISDYVFAQLRAHASRECRLLVLEDLDEAPFEEGAVVYVVGEPFAPFGRRPGCHYVYLNFSVLYLLGGLLGHSWAGYRHIRGKRRMFEAKLPSLDQVLDYYPAHTAAMRRHLRLPVRSFPVCVDPADLPPPAAPEAREYDVCVVGTETERRRELNEALRGRGHRLSPTRGVVFEEVAARSKVVLNAHAVRSSHMEVPRIVSTLLSGAALVTEHCYGMEAEIPPGLYAAGTLAELPDLVEGLLADADRRARMAAEAGRWMRAVYVPRCAEEWGRIVRDVEAAAAAARGEGEETLVALRRRA